MDNGNENTKKCGYCGSEITVKAGRCPYCGSMLQVNVEENIYANPLDAEVKSGEGDIASNEKSEDLTGFKADTRQQSDTGPALGSKPVWNTGASYRPDYKMPSAGNGRGTLSNGLKVFLTILFTVIPGIGQLAGIITAIVFMNADDDADRKSFGVALLVASIVMFLLACIGCFVLTLVFSINQSMIFGN